MFNQETVNLVVTLVNTLVKKLETTPTQDELAQFTRDTCTLLEFTEPEIKQMIREVECKISFQLEIGTLIA